MKRETSETAASNGDEVLVAQQHLPFARASTVSFGRVSAPDMLPNPVMEVLLRQALEGDQDAWAAVEQYLGETIRSWLRVHPSKEAACCWESEEHYVSLAFGRFWQVISAGQLRTCTSLPTVLRYLQVCLNGVLLDALRTKVRPKGISLQEPSHLEEQPGGDHRGDCQLWESIQRLFPDVRERQVAYFLFHCNLSPSDILRYAPHEFSDMQEICHLRRDMLDRILQHSDLMH